MIRVNKRQSGAGATTLELVVLIGVLVVLGSIFLPYLARTRELSRRAVCTDHLRSIGIALTAYANANNGSFPRVRYAAQTMPSGYVAFSGPDAASPFDVRGGVEPNDITASLWLLIRQGYVAQSADGTALDVFICPSGDERADVVGGARSNFRSGRNLGYSFCTTFSPVHYVERAEYRVGKFVVMADRNPGVKTGNVTGPAYNAPSFELSMANSLNHGRAGQNVLYVAGNVAWVKTPYCGVEGDNIYTAQAALPFGTTRPASLDWRGVCGRKYGPASIHDTFLVPTADELDAWQFPRVPATTQVATEPTTEPTTTTAPATTRAVELPASAPATAATTAPTTRR